MLVNDIWGGENLLEWNTPIWEHDLDARPADAAPGDRHAPHHEPLRAAAADPPAGRARRRDDRRHARVQRRRTTASRRSTTSPRRRSSGSRSRRATSSQPHGCTAVALTPGWMRSEMMLEIYGVTEDELARGDGRQPALQRDLRDAALRRPRGRRARRRPRPRAPERRLVLVRRRWRASTASPTSTAPSPTAGATWSRSRTPACRRTRPATAEPVPRSPPLPPHSSTRTRPRFSSIRARSFRPPPRRGRQVAAPSMYRFATGVAWLGAPGNGRRR